MEERQPLPEKPTRSAGINRGRAGVRRVGGAPPPPTGKARIAVSGLRRSFWLNGIAGDPYGDGLPRSPNEPGRLVVSDSVYFSVS